MSDSSKPQLNLNVRNIAVVKLHSYQLERAECTGCGKCEEYCPAQSISIHRHSLPYESLERKTPNGHSVSYTVSKFFLDHGSCVNCGICEEVCPTKALTSGTTTKQFSHSRDGLKVDLLSRR